MRCPIPSSRFSSQNCGHIENTSPTVCWACCAVLVCNAGGGWTLQRSHRTRTFSIASGARGSRLMESFTTPGGRFRLAQYQILRQQGTLVYCVTVCGDLNETNPHFPFSMFRPVAALSGGERPGDFRQPACGSRSGFIFFRQPAEPAALAAGTCFAGGASAFGQAAH